MNSEFRRRESRYRISDPTEVRVVVRTDDAPDPINAELIDLSNNGIQLRAFACLKFEQSIEVHVSARGFQFDLAAAVKWLRPADESSWFVGCRIEPELSEQTLTQMASMALLERRGGRRREVRLEASVCGQLERAFTPAVLRNLSEDGFGMTTAESQEVGQRIHVQLRRQDGEAIDVSARVVWQLKSSNGFVCGCELLNRESFSQLTALADSQSIRSSSTASQGDASRRNYWIGLAALVVFVFPSLFVMLSKNDASRPQPVAQTQLPETDEPLPKVPSPEHSTPAITPVATPKQRTRTAAQVKIWSNRAAHQMLELVERPMKSLLATAPAKSIVRDIEKPRTTSPNPELVATPDKFVSDAVNTDNEHLQPIDKRPNEFRTWVDDTGQYRIVARLVSVRDGNVRLFKENGRFVSVPLARLGADDQRYIHRWLQLTE